MAIRGRVEDEIEVIKKLRIEICASIIRKEHFLVCVIFELPRRWRIIFLSYLSSIAGGK